MSFRLFLPSLLSLGLLTSAMGEQQMRVTADGVNVRCGPGTGFEVVGQVQKGELVSVRRSQEEWAQIAPPADAKLWVYAELIQESTVIASRVQVRSGPGISYRPAGMLEKGAVVTVEETSNDWVRIQPPVDAEVWVSSQFLEDPAAGASPAAEVAPAQPAAVAPPSLATSDEAVRVPEKPVVPQPAPPPAAVAKPPVRVPRRIPPQPLPDDEVQEDVPGATSKLPVALTGRRLAKDRTQGEAVTLEGEVREVGMVWGKLSDYRLVGHDAQGRVVTRCYLLGNPKQLASIVGRRVSLDGQQYWVYRVRYPGVRPDHIRLYPGRP